GDRGTQRGEGQINRSIDSSIYRSIWVRCKPNLNRSIDRSSDRAIRAASLQTSQPDFRDDHLNVDIRQRRALGDLADVQPHLGPIAEDLAFDLAGRRRRKRAVVSP